MEPTVDLFERALAVVAKGGGWAAFLIACFACYKIWMRLVQLQDKLVEVMSKQLDVSNRQTDVVEAVRALTSGGGSG